MSSSPAAKSGSATIMKIHVDLKEKLGNKDSHGTVVEMLQSLKTEPITIDILAKTKIGHTVNKLRKHAHPGIAAEAKVLLRQWRTLTSNTNSPVSSPRPAAAASSPANKAKTEAKTQDEPAPSSSSSSAPTADEDAAITDGSDYPRTGVKLRDVMRKFFFRGLSKFPVPDKGISPGYLATDIEDALFAAFDSETSDAYKAKGKALSLVLADVKNPRPTELIRGALAPDDFVRLSDNDLVRPDVRELIEAAKKQGEKDMEIAKETAFTDMFKCSRCKKRECSYFQLQTRSADEPMTVFITCCNCGKKWRQ